MDWKRTGKKLLFPPLWLILPLTILSGAALAWVFLEEKSETPAAYGIYVLSFYALCVLCIFCGRTLPGACRRAREAVRANPLGNRFLTDAAFRTHVSLFSSLAANLLYVGINLLAWYLYRSAWFLVLAGYYVILAVMRFLLVRYVRTNPLGKNRLGELRRARLCAWILLTVNFALTGAVMMILYQNKGFDYHGVFIYVMAAYTFYITTHAIMDLVRYRKYRSPVMTTSKIVTLSAALVSMLALETAMFSQFGGEMDPGDQWLMIALTGAGVSIIVVTMSVYMIRKCAKEIKETERIEREKRDL